MYICTGKLKLENLESNPFQGMELCIVVCKIFLDIYLADITKHQPIKLQDNNLTESHFDIHRVED